MIIQKSTAALVHPSPTHIFHSDPKLAINITHYSELEVYLSMLISIKFKKFLPLNAYVATHRKHHNIFCFLVRFTNTLGTTSLADCHSF